MTNPVKVMIVDDHPMVAEGIQAILESYDDMSRSIATPVQRPRPRSTRSRRWPPT